MRHGLFSKANGPTPAALRAPTLSRPNPHLNERNTSMELKQRMGRAIHDNPIERIRAAAERERNNSPHAKARERQAGEVRELQQKHVAESRKLADNHLVKRGKVDSLSRPRPFRFDEGLKSERDELTKRQHKEMADLRAKHERELAKLGE
jgi:hypothetical protein